VQNVGAYGQAVSETIASVRTFDTKENEIIGLSSKACGFGYRTSVFNTLERGRYIILSVTYRLTRGGISHLKYADLQKYFAQSTGGPSLAQVRNAVREIRKSKGMLIVPGDSDSRSAGSFFKNPVLSEAQFQDLARRTASHGFKIPSYPALEAQHKVSAAWLVEHSGFAKGFTMGAAAISRKHALAIINTGNARAADVVLLKDKVQQGVQQTWGITLEPEPVFVGF
jgi:UDP-N-acetylmuramate dehydrogenase